MIDLSDDPRDKLQAGLNHAYPDIGKTWGSPADSVPALV
jgi:hypothetical protein